MASNPYLQKTVQADRAPVTLRRGAGGHAFNEDSGKPVLQPEEAARLLGTTAGNLSQLRFQNRGPAYVKDGRKVTYRQSDIDNYIMANRVVPTRN